MTAIDFRLATLSGYFESAHGIDHLDVRRIVDDAGGKLGAQDAMHHLVEQCLGYRAGLDGLFQLVAEVVASRHLHIEAGFCGFHGRVRAAPVRDDEAFKAEVVIENVAQGVVVFAGVGAVDEVVAAHHRADAGVADADLEGEQIRLAHGALVDDGVGIVAAFFLIVHRVVLDVADDVLILLALHLLSDERAGEDGVFAFVLEGAPVAWFAREVDAAAQRHGESLVAQLFGDERTVVISNFGVPAGCLGDAGGQSGSVAAVLAAASHAVGRVGYLEIGNAELRNAGDKSCAAQRAHSGAAVRR
jgi:hypothetical protein